MRKAAGLITDDIEGVLAFPATKKSGRTASLDG
jgi:hypothetical protein